MEIDDRSLNICHIITYFLTHAAEKRFHENQSAVRKHCAPAIFRIRMKAGLMTRKRALIVNAALKAFLDDGYGEFGEPHRGIGRCLDQDVLSLLRDQRRTV